MSTRIGQLVADLRNELVGVDSDGLRVGGYRGNGDLQIIDRNQICYSVGEQRREFDRLIRLRDDDAAVTVAAEELVRISRESQTLNLLCQG